jgi:hypothetical protein
MKKENYVDEEQKPANANQQASLIDEQIDMLADIIIGTLINEKNEINEFHCQSRKTITE